MLDKVKDLQTPESKTSKEVALAPLRIAEIEVVIVGQSSLLVHRFAEKARKQMRDKQQKKSTTREKRDPKADFEAAKYKLPNGGEGFRSLSIKLAMVTAISSVPGLTKVLGRQSFHIGGVMGDDGDQYIQIHGCEAVLREDPARNSSGVADLRYRPEYRDWWSVVPIQFNESVISAEQLMQVLELAGFGVGICDWRPEKGGDHGRFRLALEGEAKDLLASLG